MRCLSSALILHMLVSMYVLTEQGQHALCCLCNLALDTCVAAAM